MNITDKINVTLSQYYSLLHNVQNLQLQKSVKNKSTKNGLISVLQDALHPNRKTTSEFSEILIFLYAFKAKQKY